MAEEDSKGRVKLNPISISQLSSLIFGKGAADPKKIGQKGDPELEYLTEGNVPISEANMRIRKIRKNFGDRKDEILGDFWDSVKGGAESAYDFYNYGPKGPPQEIVIERAKKAQKELEAIRLKESSALLNEEKLKNRPDIRDVRAQITQIIAAAEKKEELNPGSVNQDELEKDLVQFSYSQGYTPREIQGGPDVQANTMPDPFGLATTSPDPFPEARIAAEITGSIGGNILGYKIGAKAFGRGAWKGLRATPGPWFARIGGAMVGGFTAVMAANYGYETALDIMNQADVFGDEGINRPDKKEKLAQAMNMGELDAKLTLTAGAFVPGIQLFRNLTRGRLGAGKNEMRLAELAQSLSKKFMKPGTYSYPGLGKFTITKEGDAILGISDISRWGGTRAVKQVLGKFPIIAGGITGNLRVKAQKLNLIMQNMNDAMGPYMTYAKLSEITKPAAFVRASKYNEYLDGLRNEWMKTADSYGDLVVIGGGINDAKTVAKNYILALEGRLGVGYEGRILPTPKSMPVKDYIEKNFLMQNDAISYSRVQEILTKELPDLMKRTGDDGLALQFVQDLKQALEKGMATSPKSAEVLVAKQAFDDAFNNGKLLFDTKVAKALGIEGMDMYGYRVKMLKNTDYADKLLDTVKFMESPEAMKNFHALVGPDIFRAALRRHVANAYNNSLRPFKGQSEIDSLFSGFVRGIDDPRSFTPKNTEGAFVDVNYFKKALGLSDPGSNKFQTLAEAFNIASKSYKPGSKIPKWARTGSSDLLDAGANAETVRVLADGTRKSSVVARMPTATEYLEFTQILEKAFAGGVPDISTFIARRAQISGLRGAIGAFRPGAKSGVAGSGAGAMLGSSLFSTVMFALIARQIGKVLTNPVNLKAFQYLLNPANPRNSIAAARALEVIGLNFKKDLDDLDRTLASIESEQLMKNDWQNLKSNVSQPMTNNEEMINKFQEQKEKINQQREFNKLREQSIPPTVVGANAAPTSPTSTAGSPVVGSSIAGNQTLNPAAAASLYAGNTDAALANQYAGGAFGNPNAPVQQMPRMAARGGIISLVS
jgi:hypothetical protein